MAGRDVENRDRHSALCRNARTADLAGCDRSILREKMRMEDEKSETGNLYPLYDFSLYTPLGKGRL